MASSHRPSKASPRSLPGYLFRRMHQVAVARFSTEVDQPFGLTPLQFATLHAVDWNPGSDQSTLSRDLALDTSTAAGVINRLEKRGLIERRPSPDDRRLRTLYLTREGSSLLKSTLPVVLGVQEWLMEPLTAKEKKQFIELMLKVIHRFGDE